jgi:hypothetical protein
MLVVAKEQCISVQPNKGWLLTQSLVIAAAQVYLIKHKA